MKAAIYLIISASLLFTPICSNAGEKATPDDIYSMVLQAYDVVKNLGSKSLVEFNNPKGEFVFKDSYVYVMKCPAEVVAHPFAIEKLRGKDLRPIYPFQKTLCDGAKNPNGTWVEFSFPKPGETKPSRKINFIINVEGTPYQVSAGIYSDTLTVEELNRTLR